MRSSNKSSVLKMLACICLLLVGLSASAAINVGDKAPEIKLKDQHGNTYALSSHQGKLVYVYFWVSWDPHSNANNPNLAVMHSKYQNMNFKDANGFEIYTVSLDSEKEEWKKAIQAHNLPGPYHVNDFYSKFAAKYGIDKLPASFLVDANGYIIAEDLNMQKLDAILSTRATGIKTGNIVPTTPAPNPTSSVVAPKPTTVTATVDAQPVNVANTTTTYTANKPAPTPAPAPRPTSSYVSNNNSTTTSVTSSAGETYKIQLGAYRKPTLSAFSNVSQFGEITMDSAPNGVKRVMLGQYNSSTSAVNMLSQVHASGYPDAFLVAYANDKRLRVLGKKEVMAINANPAPQSVAVQPPTESKLDPYIAPAPAPAPAPATVEVVQPSPAPQLPPQPQPVVPPTVAVVPNPSAPVVQTVTATPPAYAPQPQPTMISGEPLVKEVHPVYTPNAPVYAPVPAPAPTRIVVGGDMLPANDNRVVVPTNPSNRVIVSPPASGTYYPPGKPYVVDGRSGGYNSGELIYNEQGVLVNPNTVVQPHAAPNYAPPSGTIIVNPQGQTQGQNPAASELQNRRGDAGIKSSGQVNMSNAGANTNVQQGQGSQNMVNSANNAVNNTGRTFTRNKDKVTPPPATNNQRPAQMSNNGNQRGGQNSNTGGGRFVRPSSNNTGSGVNNSGSNNSGRNNSGSGTGYGNNSNRNNSNADAQIAAERAKMENEEVNKEVDDYITKLKTKTAQTAESTTDKAKKKKKGFWQRLFGKKDKKKK